MSMSLLTAHDDRLESEFLGQIERPLDLTLRVDGEEDRHLALERRLQRGGRRIVLRTRHAARIRRVRRLELSVALCIEQPCRSAAKTPINDPGYPPPPPPPRPAPPKAMCIATGDLRRMLCTSPCRRLITADCPTKIPDGGAVSAVVKPAFCAAV